MDEVEGLFYEGNSNEDRIIATAYPFGYSFAGDNIRVLSNGRVGIGNTAPGYDLSIGGAGSEKTIQIGDPSNGIFIDNGDYRPKVYGKKSNSAAWMIGISDDIDGI